jgi:uncharacterized protein YbdZ (MbtH family)
VEKAGKEQWKSCGRDVENAEEEWRKQGKRRSRKAMAKAMEEVWKRMNKLELARVFV